jgi:hypothetical protein
MARFAFRASANFLPFPSFLLNLGSTVFAKIMSPGDLTGPVTDQRLLRTASDKARLPTQVVEHTFRKVYRDDGERAAKRVRYFAEPWKELRGGGPWEQNPFLVAISLPVIKGNIDAPEATVAA